MDTYSVHVVHVYYTRFATSFLSAEEYVVGGRFATSFLSAEEYVVGGTDSDWPIKWHLPLFCYDSYM